MSNPSESDELRFVEFLLRSLDEHLDADGVAAALAHKNQAGALDEEAFYADLYSAWASRAPDARKQDNVVAFRPESKPALGRQHLIAKSILHMPRAAAAAGAETSARRIATRDGQTIGTIDCIDSGDEASFYVVFRFTGPVAWASASLVVLGRQDGLQESIRLESKNANEQLQQMVLDRIEHKALYDMLRDPMSEAVIVEGDIP